ncbi:MAG: hypothetical protein QOE73_2611 [Verrucomicrobiota bacterium]|jgi:hypothetical protein
MKNTLLKPTVNFSVVALLSLLFAVSAVATPSESSLTSAGFKAKAATTTQQRQQLKSLPEGKVSTVTQNGKTFYVYPDAQRGQIYVGNEAEYQAYENLATNERGSARPIVTTSRDKGNPIKVREIHGFGPLDDMR